MPLTSAVVKCVPIVKEYITPQFLTKTSNVLLTINDDYVTYPLVIIDIEGIKCRALIDIEAGASYPSSTLIDRINKISIRKQYKQIETIMGSSAK